MKQDFRYKEKEIKEVMSVSHDIHSIDISDSDKLRNTINNIVHFLELENVILVARAQSLSNYVEFTLKSAESISKMEFHDAIKKFQKHIETASNPSDLVKREDLIEEVKKFISNSPKNHDVYIGLTYHDENETKIDCDLPTFWFYKTFPKGTEVTIFRYFIRKGYKKHHYPTGGA